MTASTCPALVVTNGTASSASPSEVTQIVDITCDDGYIQHGTSATCSPDGVGKAKWTNIPTCEGLLKGCLYAALTFLRDKQMFQLVIIIVYRESHHKLHNDCLIATHDSVDMSCSRSDKWEGPVHLSQ